MTPTEAIAKLEDMQKKDFGEMAQMLREAKTLIEHFGWTSSERTDVIMDAEKWLRGTEQK